jgi:hypothetical protein
MFCVVKYFYGMIFLSPPFAVAMMTLVTSFLETKKAMTANRLVGLAFMAS